MEQDPKNRALFYQILIYLVLVAGIFIAGYLYYHNYEQEFRTGIDNQLTSVGDLKVDELTRWRQERLGDAQVLYRNPAFSSLVSGLQLDPLNAKLHSELSTWLLNVQEHYHYNRVYILTPQGKLQISAPNSTEPISSIVLENISSVLNTGEITVLDFYQDEYDQKTYLTILIPVFDEETGKRSCGVVGLQIDPEYYLYPFISRRPTPSTTAETLLIRRDGDNVLYLNTLRFRPDTPLSIRLPLNLTNRPSVKAVLGQEGIVEGVDYRGVPVIAYIHKIPNSPWYLVSRIDISEVYQPLHARTLDLIIIVLFLLIGTGTGMYLLRMKENERFYREQLKIKEALREANHKLSLLTGLTRHDILNQLTAIQLLHDMALDSSDPEKIHEYISRAKKTDKQIETTIGFTKEFESFGGALSGWQSLYLIIEAAKKEVTFGKIKIENHIPKELEIYADPIIRKVFSTLLENAIRHGGDISVIIFSCYDLDNSLIITCIDDGVGIAVTQKENIFNHGYGKHTGIGLFLSREILSITGLSIRECGVPGEGARFEILVPEGKFRMT